MNQPRPDISPRRKVLYYGGGSVSIIGLILFLSVFITGISRFGDFTDFEARTRSEAMRGVLGMIMIAVGAVIATIGARGAAGSGVILDPQKARKDLEPWNRMAGGMANDALSEIEVVQKVVQKLSDPPPPAQPPQPPIKLRCRNCQTLCNEQAKFCSRCGQPL